MKIIDGKLISEKIYLSIQKEILSLTFKPKLGIILASDDEASVMYIKKMKMKKAMILGIDTHLITFSPTAKKQEIIKVINEFNNDNSINGILVQVPLYPHLEKNRFEILNAISPLKDADGLSALNLGLTSQLTKDAIPPATVGAIWESIKFIVEKTFNNGKEIDENLKRFLISKDILIINNTTLVGKPLSLLLSTYDSTVTLANKFTKNLRHLALAADIIISATNQTNIIDHTMIKDGVVLIDVTSNKDKDKVLGDITISDELILKTSWLTPVPGGVGPITIACLMRNVVKLGKQQNLI